MAITLTELAILLTGDTSQLDKDLDGAAKTTRGWASNLGGTITKVLGGAVAGAGLAAAGAIVGIGSAAANVSNQTRTAAADMAASLGIPIEEAERFAEVAKQVYGNNFAGSVSEAADAVELLVQQLGFADDPESIQELTEKAFGLADTFDVEVGESVDAVKVLMDEMGLSANQAFDFVTKGFQSGLNRSGDFIDTISEYGNQFGSAGFDAEQFFSILETGTQGGVLGTDKIADAIKEMNIRLNEGGDDAVEAFGDIGLNFDQIAASVAAGDETWAEYFDDIVAGLNEIDDPIARSQAQVAIFGTQAEDLGVAFTEGLSTASTALADMEGAADSLNVRYETFGDFFTGLWRRTVVAVTPLTDTLLGLANDALPSIESAFDNVSGVLTSVVNAINLLITGDFSGGIFGLTEDHPAIGALFTFRDAIQRVANLFGGGGGEGGGFAGGILSSVGVLDIFKSWFDENLPLIQETVQTILGGIQGFWEQNADSILTVVQNVWSAISLVIETAMQVILNLITLVMQIITGDWEGAWETLKETAQLLMDAILELLELGLEQFQELFKIAFNAVVSAVRTLVTSVKEAFTEIDWGDVGRSIIMGIANGIKRATSIITSAARDAASSAFNSAKRFLRIGSPSKLAEEELGVPFAEGIGEGAMRGIQDLTGQIQSGLGNLAGSMTVSPAAAGTSGGDSFYVVVNAGPGTDVEATRGAVRDGVLEAQRARGG